MLGDLHLHTRHSDGSMWPEEALVAARSRGLGYVSFVDHDTTVGTAHAVSIGLRLGITVIPGVEISAWNPERSRKVHILGYNYRLPARNIEALCRPLREARDANTREQIREVIRARYPITVEAVEAHALGVAGTPRDARRAGNGASVPILYKQHIMLALIDAGYTDEIYSDLYRTLFKGNGPAAHDIEYVDARDAVRAIRADGGIAVLAHPGQLDSWDMVPALVEAGLGGIELYHGDQTLADQARTRALAAEFALVMTGGSDDHGDYGSVHRMGDICAPAGAFESLTSPADEEAAWAVARVREAGALARQAVAEEADVALKGGDIKDLVTEHDIAIDRHLFSAISARFPDHGFLTEEHSHPEIAENQPFWVIDPIDGTTNFVTRRDTFAISVAHYNGDTPRFGIVYDVMQDELYLGVHGEGAWLNGVRLPAVGAKPIAECVVECSLNAVHELLRHDGAFADTLVSNFRATRSGGSAALAICRIARDTVDVYLSSNVAVWDYAAAIIVLREVGGDWVLPGRAGDVGDNGTADRTAQAGGSVSPRTLHSRKVLFLAARDADLVREAARLLLQG